MIPDANNTPSAPKSIAAFISSPVVIPAPVNTFTTLCGKAIEHFSMLGNDKYMEYVEMMKNIQMEKVNKLTIDDEKEIKEHANKP